MHKALPKPNSGGEGGSIAAPVRVKVEPKLVSEARFKVQPQDLPDQNMVKLTPTTVIEEGPNDGRSADIVVRDGFKGAVLGTVTT